MDRVNKAACVAIVFFSVVLAGFIGSRVDQTTIALLGGTFIGLVVAIPATVLVVLLALNRRQENTGPVHYHMPRGTNPPQHHGAVPQYYMEPPVAPPPAYRVEVPAATQRAYPPLPAQRAFHVLGDDGEMRLLTDGRDDDNGF